MAEFYEKVATPDSGFRQSKAPSGPEVDIDARQEARNDMQSGLGASIMNLIGAASGVSNIAERQNQQDKADMIKKHSMDVKIDSSDYAERLQLHTEKKSQQDFNKDEKELTRDERVQIKNDFDSLFIKKYSDKPYIPLLKEEIDRKGTALIIKKDSEAKEFNRNKKYEQYTKMQLLEFNNTDDPKEIVSILKENRENTIGIGLSIEDSEDNANIRLLQGVVEKATRDRDYKMLNVLKSKEMKDFFNLPDYKNALQVLEKQTQSRVNQERQTSYDRIEEQAYLGVQSNAFSSVADVEDFVNTELSKVDKAVRPDTKNILRLKARLIDGFKDQAGYQQVKRIVDSGDSTYMERAGIPKKTRDAYNNQMFQDAVGLDSLDPETLTTVINSGERDGEIRAAFNIYGKVPPALKLYGEAPITGGIKEYREVSNAYRNASVLTEGTSVSLNDIYKPERQTELLYLGRLLDDADSGVISEADATQVFRNFQNDIKRNRDSFGNYVSPSAQEFLAGEETQEWLTEQVTDAPWTTDEQSSQAYRRRQFVHYFNLAMETTDDPSVARDKAEDMFFKRHKDIEAPNGEETILPSEFMDFDNRDFLKVANNHPDFKPFRDLGYFSTGLGSDNYFENSISFSPDSNYEKNKIMNLYYGEGADKKLVMSVTPRVFNSILDSVNNQIIQEAEARRKQRIEDFQNK